MCRNPSRPWIVPFCEGSRWNLFHSSAKHFLHVMPYDNTHLGALVFKKYALCWFWILLPRVDKQRFYITLLGTNIHRSFRLGFSKFIWNSRGYYGFFSVSICFLPVDQTEKDVAKTNWVLTGKLYFQFLKNSLDSYPKLKTLFELSQIVGSVFVICICCNWRNGGPARRTCAPERHCPRIWSTSF